MKFEDHERDPSSIALRQVHFTQAWTQTLNWNKQNARFTRDLETCGDFASLPTDLNGKGEMPPEQTKRRAQSYGLTIESDVLQLGRVLEWPYPTTAKGGWCVPYTVWRLATILLCMTDMGLTGFFLWLRGRMMKQAQVRALPQKNRVVQATGDRALMAPPLGER